MHPEGDANRVESEHGCLHRFDVAETVGKVVALLEDGRRYSLSQSVLYVRIASQSFVCFMAFAIDLETECEWQNPHSNSTLEGISRGVE